MAAARSPGSVAARPALVAGQGPAAEGVRARELVVEGLAAVPGRRLVSAGAYFEVVAGACLAVPAGGVAWPAQGAAVPAVPVVPLNRGVAVSAD